MRVIVATTAGAGHFAGVLPFARACSEAGHEVRVSAPASFAPSVEGAGFAHEPFADADPAALGAVFGRLPSLPMGEADDLVLREVFGRIDTNAALPGMRALVKRWRPDVVLREPAELASYVVAQENGVPHVQCNIGLDLLADRFLSCVEDPLRELGCDTQGLREAPRWTVVPPAFDARAQVVTGSLTAARDPAEDRSLGGLPDAWGGSDDPLVYVTFGSIAAGLDLFPTFYAAVIEQLASLSVRVLMTLGEAGDPDALQPLPPGVHVERWWPQADVMPHASVVVGHGGFGTTQSALVAGVPQVVIPLFSFDQFENARRVDAVGVGRALVDPDAAHRLGGDVLSRGPTATAQLAETVLSVLGDPVLLQRAKTLAADLTDLPNTADVVSSLPSFLP